jgi:uncharacterized protein
MISIREEIEISTPPEVLWPILSDPAIVASCIPGAVLSKSGEGGVYQGTMRVKFGPTVAVFRGEAKLDYDHSARRCTIEGRGIDGRGASRANVSGIVEATGSDRTALKVEGHFNVTGPLETFANAGGIHLARVMLAEFAENVAKLIPDQVRTPASDFAPLAAGGDKQSATREREDEQAVAFAAPELKGGKILWRTFLSWLRQVFFGKRNTQ